MKRRSFLGLIGAAGLAPALPAAGAPAPVAAKYNRYMYGLAVFHARTRATLSAADLVARLKVSAVQAEAMMGEMAARGVVAPVAKAAGGAVRALDPHYRSEAGVQMKRAVRKLSDWIADDVPVGDEDATVDRTDTAAEMKEPDNGQV